MNDRAPRRPSSSNANESVLSEATADVVWHLTRRRRNARPGGLDVRPSASSAAARRVDLSRRVSAARPRGLRVVRIRLNLRRKKALAGCGRPQHAPPSRHSPLAEEHYRSARSLCMNPCSFTDLLLARFVQIQHEQLPLDDEPPGGGLLRALQPGVPWCGAELHGHTERSVRIHLSRRKYLAAV